MAEGANGAEGALPPFGTGPTVYFAFFLGILIVLLLVNISVREYVWGGFSLVGIGFLVWNAVLFRRYQGAVFLDRDTDLQLLVVTGHCLILAAYVLGALMVPRDHKLSWIRGWFYGAAGINAALASAAPFLPAMIAATIFNIAIIASFAVLAVPQLAARTVGPERRRTGIAITLVAGLGVAVVLVLAIFVFKTTGFSAYFINLAITAALIIGGAVLSIRRIFAIRDDRERVLRDMLETTRKEAETSHALLEAERKYAEVRDVAKLRQDRLAEASHDIKQPIASLRTTMDAVARDQPEEIQNQLRNAFDYLEQLASAYMADAAPDAGRAKEENAAETVAASLLLETLDRMFRAEAEEKGLVFEVAAEAAQVKVQPLAVMRILSNLVSNAIRHTDQGTVSLRASTADAYLIVSVRNTGAGLSELDLERLSEPYAKGAGSPGAGLGLSIVRQLARNAGLGLSFRADEDGETGEFLLKLPLA